ncbi:MAG: flavin reductase family protein [Candidatus Poseidoniaceae archaeon]|nr:flavin reductase family protein [Candidatus Poseidoniaceae archaeon]
MDRKAIVLDYLRKCNAYAEKSISRKQERGESEQTSPWTSYIEFNEHAIEEINNGTLNHWFTPMPTSNLENAKRLEVESIEHAERAGWLSGLLSPRPLVLASTQDEDGNKNLAPYTSVMAVSTRPPLLIASFSCNREGRYRDTLHNLRSTKRAILHLMPSTLDAVKAVDETAAPVPHGESEWNLAGLTASPLDPLLVNEAVAALEVEFIEDRPLPDAVARLAVLRVTGLWTTESDIPANGLDILCQHGHDRLSPAPDAWGEKVLKHYGSKKLP